MKKLLLCFMLIGCVLSSAQVIINDEIGGDLTPEPSAVLDLRSTTRGLLLPRTDNAPANPVAGLIYYDITEKCFKGYNGTTWDAIGDACKAVITTAYTVSIADATNVVEGANQIFTVSISPAVAGGDVVTVEYVTSESSPISAIEDTDYSSDIGTLTFNAADTSKNIVIITADDTDVESNESYTVELSNVAATGNATASLGTAIATGIIEDNDGAVNGTNLLNNGGFEAGDVSGWDTAEATTVIASDVQEGTYAAQVIGGRSDLIQTINVTGGETYTISFWYKVVSGDLSTARIWSSWVVNTAANPNELRGPNNSYLDNNGGAWIQYSVTLTAPANETGLRLETRTYGGGTVLYDGFSVIQQ